MHVSADTLLDGNVFLGSLNGGEAKRFLDQRREIDLILLVKHLLYDEKYTIEGARQKVDEHRRGGNLKAIARGALGLELIQAIEEDARAILEIGGGAEER